MRIAFSSSGLLNSFLSNENSSRPASRSASLPVKPLSSDLAMRRRSLTDASVLEMGSTTSGSLAPVVVNSRIRVASNVVSPYLLSRAAIASSSAAAFFSSLGLVSGSAACSSYARRTSSSPPPLRSICPL